MPNEIERMKNRMERCIWTSLPAFINRTKSVSRQSFQRVTILLHCLLTIALVSLAKSTSAQWQQNDCTDVWGRPWRPVDLPLSNLTNP